MRHGHSLISQIEDFLVQLAIIQLQIITFYTLLFTNLSSYLPFNKLTNLRIPSLISISICSVFIFYTFSRLFKPKNRSVITYYFLLFRAS